MVLQRRPEDLQDITLGAFNALVDLVTLKAFGFGNHGFHTPFDGFIKCGLLAGLNTDVGELENHFGFPVVG